jgi:hypothetical protein
MIKIGVVNIDVSHPLAFAKILQTEDRARFTAIYNDGFRGDDEMETFIRNFKLEKRCSTITELAECVDIGFIQGCNWDKHIEHAIPFIEAGKPVFIDKPIVGSVADCRIIEKLASNGAVILGSSSVRYCQEIINFFMMAAEERGEIISIFGTSGIDEFNYGIHIVEAITELAGSKACSCKYVGSNSIDNKKCETFFVKFENGVTATYNTFQGLWQPFEVVIITTTGIWQFRIDCGKIYKALLDRICDYMETGNNKLAPVSVLTQPVKIMLAGRISREQNGMEIPISEIPDDDPGYNGTVFEKSYAAVSPKMYLDSTNYNVFSNQFIVTY